MASFVLDPRLLFWDHLRYRTSSFSLSFSLCPSCRRDLEVHSIAQIVQLASSRWCDRSHLLRRPEVAFSISPEYSLSFDFGELRFCHVVVHSSREAAADARSSAGEDDRCAKWYGNAQSLRQLQHFRGGHGQRRGAALEGRLESAAVSSRVFRERRANDAGHPRAVLY